MDKAIEAAAMLAETTISRNGHEMDMPYADMQHIWESAKRSGLARVQMAKYRLFLKAYLSALKEDPEVLERVAEIIRTGVEFGYTDNVINAPEVARAALSALEVE